MPGKSQNAGALSYMVELLFTPIPFLTRDKSKKRLHMRRARIARKSANANPAVATRSFIMNGLLEKGTGTPFAIGGEDFVIDENTWVFGDVRVGTLATVRGERHGSKNYAKKVVIS